MEGGGNDQIMHLPPGFRFHPTDEELITHYLSKKVVDYGFSSVAIAEVDMNKVEPWDLPWRAKLGEKEWYFFCMRDRKYPTGHRTNRATKAGYWKATGKDKEIFRGKALVGMKKTLVFYQGRAPKGTKSNWVSHEYRLEGKSPVGKSEKNDWVITRVFQKTSSGEKVHISCLHQVNTDFSGSGRETKPVHVHCFSNAPTGRGEIQGEDVMKAWFGNPDTSYGVDSFPLDSFPKVELFGVDGLDQGILSAENIKQEFGQEPGSSVSVMSNGEMGTKMIGGLTEGQDNFDCIWSY